MNVLHTAVWVSSLDETKDFYCDSIGLNHSRDFTTNGVKNYFVAGDADAEIQFKFDPDRDVNVRSDGFDHLAVGVNNVEAVFDRLVNEHGSDVIKKPTTLETTGSTIAFVTDPDGYTVELIQKA